MLGLLAPLLPSELLTAGRWDSRNLGPTSSLSSLLSLFQKEAQMVLGHSPHRQQQQQLASSKLAAFVLLFAALWPIAAESAATAALRRILFPGKSLCTSLRFGYEILPE